ncbi:helix-turn-helix transcriptional regulator [Polyangium jinanense]|uniref:helix-turn-helix domain-containing protein n=1 Tax=Polyangium jinanense TaxID=2829994 RepID=UPI002340DCDE|nr:helix-turn-helix transcriptional regulator [Polyangium jinanense]MDC3956886.1 helix-turn-helix transcriptional regulator [Polyangium jinanense]
MAGKSFSARLGARLRARREALGLSQAELAEKVDISANYVGVLERGLKLPTLDTLVALAKALDVPVADLLGEPRADPWLEEVVTVAATMPKQLRPVALAVLRAMAAQK